MEISEQNIEVVEIKLHSGRFVHYYVCPTTYALLTGDTKELQLLLWYGHRENACRAKMLSLQQHAKFENINNFKCLAYRRAYGPCVEESKEPIIEGETHFIPCIHVDGSMIDECFLQDEKRTFYESDALFLRKKVVNQVIIFLLKYVVTRSVRVRCAMINCFRIVWRARSEPYVRIQEICEILEEDWICQKCPRKCWKRLRSDCNMYGELFNDMAFGVLEPRSLQQLSRCAIRKALRCANVGYFGIKKLPVPNRMISYLKYEF